MSSAPGLGEVLTQNNEAGGGVKRGKKCSQKPEPAGNAGTPENLWSGRERVPDFLTFLVR